MYKKYKSTQCTEERFFNGKIYISAIDPSCLLSSSLSEKCVLTYLFMVILMFSFFYFFFITNNYAKFFTSNKIYPNF